MGKDISNEMYAFKYSLEVSKELGLKEINIDVLIEEIDQLAYKVNLLEESICND